MTDRYSNPLYALDLLGRAEFWLFGVRWHTEPGSECSEAVKNVLWQLELLQGLLETEFQTSCKQLVNEQVVE